MCTVVCRSVPGEPLQVLALRDEFTDRAFDEPAAWWPEQPSVIGGRDRAAGGTWCASDVTTGTTALLVNRTERFVGRPSRGLLPLAAVAAGDRWSEDVDHRQMASFNLVRADPTGTTVWVWDATALSRIDLRPGTHVVTSPGVDADDARARLFQTAPDPATWLDVVGACRPSADPGALVVRRPFDGRTYATVFGQLITAGPGRLDVQHTRTPWLSDTWSADRWQCS